MSEQSMKKQKYSDKSTFNFKTKLVDLAEISELIQVPQFFLESMEKDENFIVVWDPEEKRAYFSKSIGYFLNIHTYALMRMSWRDFIKEEKLKEIIKKLFSKEIQEEFSFELNDYKKRSIYFNGSVKKIKVDQKDYFFSLFQIATPDKQKEKVSKGKMLQSEKMNVVGQLAAGIAHEIRNPLTSLKGFLQLLQAGMEQKEVYYKIMSDELDKIESITSELLFISKPFVHEKNFVSVQSMVNEVIILLNTQANIHQVHLTTEYINDYEIYCDRSQIKQVLINLIKNAIEATEKAGNVTVKVQSKEEKVMIDIIDEGPGIPDEHKKKIIEPFFTTKESGTGLGLMITKQILEQHNGELKIESQKGKGSTFRMILPFK